MPDERLLEAHALIEQGRFTEARMLLRTIDDPTARQWLAQLNAPKRPQKPTSVTLPLLIAIAAVIGVGALIVMLLLTPTLLNRLQNQNSEQTLTEDEVLYANLIQWCQTATGFGSEEPCMSWGELVMRDYHAAAVACIGQFGIDTPEGLAQTGECLTTNGVPPPL